MSITKEILLRNSQEKLADIILALVRKSCDAYEHLQVIIAGCDPDPTRSISMIKKKIASLKDSTEFVSFNRSFDLSNQIEQVCSQIMEDVLPKSPNEAVTLLLSLIKITNDTMERVDRSGGSVGHAFSGACSDLAKAYEQATYPLNDVVDFVYYCLMNDNYGVYERIIPDFKTALGSSGLQALQQKLQNSEVADYKKSIVRKALQNIADVCNDVNAYIEACSFGQELRAAHENINIAKRLINRGCCIEAIRWLDSADVPTWQTEEKRQLRLQALEQCNDVVRLEQAE